MLTTGDLYSTRDLLQGLPEDTVDGVTQRLVVLPGRGLHVLQKTLLLLLGGLNLLLGQLSQESAQFVDQRILQDLGLTGRVFRGPNQARKILFTRTGHKASINVLSNLLYPTIER